GFLETPYKRVKIEKKGNKTVATVTNDVDYLQADDEEQYYITSANIALDENGVIQDEMVVARHKGEIIEVPVEQINYIDVSPRQAIGISAAMIPFIQNDDASRALMGSHMQCQAVPLVKPQAPFVGTGMEEIVSKELGRTIVAP